MNTDTRTHSHVRHLYYGDKEIILVGTAHVSRDSVDLVRQVILEEKPDTVAVELCRSRYQALTDKSGFEGLDLVRVIRDKKAFLLLTSIILTAIQKKIAAQIGVTPGAEMLKAIDTANETGAIIHLADREINITLSRTWRCMDFTGQLKLLGQMLLALGKTDEIREDDIERMKNEDALQAILAEVEKTHPSIRKTLIDERDQYLCHRIRTAPGNKIVAVVGAGHVPGILKNMNRKIDIEALDVIPDKKRFFPDIKKLLLIIMIILLSGAFYLKGTGLMLTMAGKWAGIHAFLAGLGTSAACGHPAAVISAMVSSPVTSLTPFMSTGWISGLTQALVVKPHTLDLENLSTDILTVKGFWKNKVTRTLLVVIFANAGCMAGSIAALPFLLSF